MSRLGHPDDLPEEFFMVPDVQVLRRPIKMSHVVRIRARIIRLRKSATWVARRMADTLEAKLLSRMSWTQ